MFLKTGSIFAIGVSILLFFSCSQKQKPSSENNPGENKITPGAQIFNDNCVECHGLDGKRQLGGAKDLSISTLRIEERIKIISSAQLIGNIFHKARWEKILSENEIKEVAHYLDSLRK